MNVQELERKIIEASQAYYSGEPICSDKEFDDMIEYLKAANPNSEILTKVGWGYNPFKQVGEKENHIYGKVLGIDRKPRNVEDIPKDFYNDNIKLCLSAKLDGLSMVCYFVKGKFVKALTRGNGDTGINRTDKISKILEKELSLPEHFDFTGAIRGEVCISNENWKIMQELGIAGSNQRNTATGIINRDEIQDDIKYLDLIFYKVVGYNNDYSLTYNKIYLESVIELNNFDVKFLRKFIKPEYIVSYVEDSDSYKNLTQENLEKLFESFNNSYPCDGIVITKNLKHTNSLNNNRYFNNISIMNDEIAYKFITETAITTIENIRWKMSKGNKAIPVINVKPVELSGATIYNASAFNAKYIYENDLDVGSEVELVRSGEVIPYITKVISNSNGKGKEKLDNMICPYCGTKLVWEGVDLVCKNAECGNRDEQNLKVWVRNIAPIDGISEILIFKFFEELNINSLEDLYSHSYNDLAYSDVADNTHKGKFNKVLNKLFNEPVKFKDLLVALNIKMLGIKSAEKLISNIDFRALFEEYLDIEEGIMFVTQVKPIITELIGPAIAESICSIDGMSKIKNAIYVKDRIDFAYEEKEELIPVVITGKLSVPRKEFEKYLNDNGYEVKGAINKDIKYLITDNPDSNSSKNQAANKFGIEKISEQEIREIINDKNSFISKDDIL